MLNLVVVSGTVLLARVPLVSLLVALLVALAVALRRLLLLGDVSLSVPGLGVPLASGGPRWPVLRVIAVAVAVTVVRASPHWR